MRKPVKVLFILLACSLGIRLNAQSAKLQPFFEFYMNGELDSARIFLEAEISKSPDQPQLHLYLGNIFSMQHKDNKAVYEFEQAINENKDDSKIYFKMAQAYERQEMYTKAAEIYKESIKADSSFLNSRLRLAALYYNLTQYENAINLSRSILSIDSLHIPALQRLGKCYIKAARFDSAVIVFRKALTIDSVSYQLKLNLAFSLLKIKNHKKAILIFEELISKNAHSEKARFYLAEAYTQSGEFTEAIRQYKYCSELKGKYRLEALRRLAQLLYHLEHYQECLTVADQILFLSDDDYGAHYYRGLSLSELGSYAEAEKEFELTIKLSNTDFIKNIYMFQGLNFYHQKKYRDAIQSYRKLLTLDPWYGLALYNIAVTYDEFYEDKNNAKIYYEMFVNNEKKDAEDYKFIERAKNRLKELKEKEFFKH